MRPILTLFVLLLLAGSSYSQVNYSALVNPFIGTGGHGHTFPGATRPFGMVQLSPDTRLEGWDGCSGYHYSDQRIYGFSHTHLSGTGVADYCDILLMPFVGEVAWDNRSYSSGFSHEEEKASAGYYEVMLQDYKIHAALTASPRAGMHAYTYGKGTGEERLLIDLKHRDEVLDASLEQVSPTEIRGFRRSRSWAQNQVVYFYIRFSRPVRQLVMALDDQEKPGITKAGGKNLKAWMGFEAGDGQPLLVKVGLSGVSTENARLNLDTEIPHWDFDLVKKEAEKDWNTELGKIEVQGGTRDQQVSFYTALYHTMIAPNLYSDVNGEYRGMDGQVHRAAGYNQYTVFSLWDTYRALHPLHTLLQRERTRDWIRTFLAQYQQGGMLPVWELSANETFCMIGYHSVPVIADAWQKGIHDFDLSLALKAMTDYAESNRFGLDAYRRQGFVSNTEDHESASKTMEYAYDDWCISKFAEWTGQPEIARRYRLRSLQWRNLFDPKSRHIRGKVQGFWMSPFDATEINNFYTEGNAWHYSFAAPHDMEGMIRYYGGEKAFAEKLEELFTTDKKTTGRDQADVTGLIGQYAHGNEPSHHMAYLFNYCGKPWRTQELVSRICKEFYPNSPDGLIGNEDCGQMSAWYVFSALGFYPVTPGSGEYAIGTPLFSEITLHPEGSPAFQIRAKQLEGNNIYVQETRLNGAVYPKNFLRHTDLVRGGDWMLIMGPEPNRAWGVADSCRAKQAVADKDFAAVPFFATETFKFRQPLSVQLGHIDRDAAIWYRVETPGKSVAQYIRYTKPFILQENATVRMYAQRGAVKSPVVHREFFRLRDDRQVKVESQVHPMYTAGGPEALVDGILGSDNWRAGDWQSYYNQDFVAVVDLKKEQAVTYAGLQVLQDAGPWILYPKEIIIESSADGSTYTPLATVVNTVSKEDRKLQSQVMGAAVKTKARYLRFRAVSGGTLPAWHESAGSPSHLFVGEIVVR